MKLLPRVIPVLLLDEDAFVKTVGFERPVYVGDPVNVINLFNRFEVDEIVLLDISATRRGVEPNYGLINELASECWVPLSYGGGVRSYEQAKRILSIGVEKVVLGASVADHPGLVGEVAETHGRQAVVAAIDARRRGTATPASSSITAAERSPRRQLPGHVTSWSSGLGRS